MILMNRYEAPEAIVHEVEYYIHEVDSDQQSKSSSSRPEMSKKINHSRTKS